MRGFALSAVLVVCVCRHPTAGAPLRPPLARAPLDVRGGGPNFFAGESSPFDALRGRKVVPQWDGDLVDLVEMACIGLVAGSASRVVLKVASGVAANVAAGLVVVAALHYSGVIQINADKLRGLANAALPGDLANVARRFRDPAGREVLKDELHRRAADWSRANEHRALGGVGGLAASYFVL